MWICSRIRRVLHNFPEAMDCMKIIPVPLEVHDNYIFMKEGITPVGKELPAIVFMASIGSRSFIDVATSRQKDVRDCTISAKYI